MSHFTSLLRGILPSATPLPLTFHELAEQWLAVKGPTFRPHWGNEARRLLNRELVPALGPHPAGRIRKAEISQILEGLAKTPGIARNTHALLRCIFRWGVATGRIEADPTTGLRTPVLPARERTLSLPEVGLVWQGCGPMGDFGRMVRLLLLTGLRRGEVGGLRWEEVGEGEGGAVLTLPKGRTKSRRVHILPLTGLAVAQFPDRRVKRGLIFPPSRANEVVGKPFSAWQSGTERLAGQLGGMPSWCLHDLRRTVATGLGELGVADEVIGRVLGHAPSGVTRVHYNHSRRLAEVRAALEIWESAVKRAASIKEIA